MDSSLNPAVDCPRVRLGITGLNSAADPHWAVPETYGDIGVAADPW
jgi:hypothetical protein